MAVARMSKVTAFGHRSVLREAIDRLQDAGTVQVIRDDTLPRVSSTTDLDVRHDVEEKMAKTDFVIGFLGRFHENEAPFSTFVSEKFHVDKEEFLSLDFDEKFDGLYQRCQSVSGRLAEIEREKERLRDLAADLAPWGELHLQIQRWKGTDRVTLFTGTVGANRGAEVRQELRDAVPELSIEELGAVGTRQAWVVMVIPEYEESVRTILSRTDFEEASFPDLWDYPAEEISRAEESISRMEGEEAGLLKQAASLADRYPDAVTLGEALRARRGAELIRDDLGSTDRTFSVSGWAPTSASASIEQALADLEGVDVGFSDPGPEDEIPVLLDNPKWMKPFEVVTDLYGRPKYGEIDPTPALFIWFFFFFGLCLGDVGYGLALIAVSWLIKHRLDVAQGVHRFMDLMMYGGVASVIVGIFTGSYFALDMAKLPDFMRSLVILDPMRDVSEMLILSIALGVVHVLWGVIIRAWDLFRNGKAVDAFADEISTLMMWGSAVLMVLGAGSWLTTAGGVGLAVVLLLKGRVVFPPFGLGSLLGLLKGAFGIYNTVVGHIADFLSYTRLAALGMATILVGQVMNIVAELVSDSVKIAALGFVLAALVFVVGHVFNLAISLLGAFVHTLRLQFVEFFGKFYTGGGKAFAPFDYGTRSSVLRRDPVQEEGG